MGLAKYKAAITRRAGLVQQCSETATEGSVQRRRNHLRGEPEKKKSGLDSSNFREQPRALHLPFAVEIPPGFC